MNRANAPTALIGTSLLGSFGGTTFANQGEIYLRSRSQVCTRPVTPSSHYRMHAGGDDSDRSVSSLPGETVDHQWC